MYYNGFMKALTLNPPHSRVAWLEQEARRVNRPKSALVREVLQQHQHQRDQNALDLASDLCGCVDSGLRGLSRSKKRLKGFGR